LSNLNIIIIFFFGLALWGAYYVYEPFLFPIVIALLLTMATFNATAKLTKKLGGSRIISSFISTMMLFLLLFVPISYIAVVIIDYLSNVDRDMISVSTNYIKALLKELPYGNEISQEFFKDEEILSAIKAYSSYLTSAGSAGIGFVKNILLVIVFYFVLNFYGDRVFSFIQSLIPIPTIKSTKIISSVSSMMEVVFYSIVVTAILEGFLFGFFIQFYGFDGLLFGIIYGFASLIPVVGGALVWVPLSIYSWKNLGVDVSIEIATYTIVVISIVADTFIKPLIIRLVQKDMLKSTHEINELLIFFSILSGMASFGFWGMILGPAITSFLLAMMNIYIEEHKENYKEKVVKKKNRCENTEFL